MFRDFEYKTAMSDGASLFTELERMHEFRSKYNTVPPQIISNLANSMGSLSDSVPAISNPETNDQVMQGELKRRLGGEAFMLGKSLTGESWAFSDVLKVYGINQTDLDGLRPWLEANKEETLESASRIYRNTPASGYRVPVSVDIPQVRNRAELFAEDKISTYFGTIGKLLEKNSGVSLSSIQAVPTTMGRSYFNNLTKTLAIGIPAIVYSTKRNPFNLDVQSILRLIGHEGMGHALNNLASQDNEDLPFFLRQHSTLTEGTAESVAQHFEDEIFGDIEASPETQRELGIEDDFSAIQREVKDTRLLEDYQRKFFQYALTVLADETLAVGGSPNTNGALKRKHEALIDMALNPADAGHIIDSNIHNFDRMGNLNPGTASEMRYAAQPVKRALEIFAANGLTDKSLINRTLLTGYWTPEGFVENAKVVASNA